MTLCATEETKGFYFGYFWVIFESCISIGGFSGAKLIGARSLSAEIFVILSII